MTKVMKKTLLLLWMAAITATHGQTVKESTSPLSKAAQKGFLDQTTVSNDGNIKLVYQMKGGGKDEILFEEYTFNSDFKLLETKPTSVQKEIKPDTEKERMFAWVGACSSFDINSMKLRISRDKVKMEWDYKRQRYKRTKTLDSETIKLKNEKGNFYYGIDAVYDEVTDKVAVFVYTETKDKANPRKYAIVKFGTSGDPEEMPIELSGAYSIVYTQPVRDFRTNEDGFVAVFAPHTGDLTKYVFIHYDLKGNQKSKVTFDSPAPSMLVLTVIMQDGAYYLYGTSIESKKGYKDEFDDYVPLRNPCYKDYANVAMYSYTKKADQSMDNFHFIKIKDGEMRFATAAPFSSIKTKMKTPPSQKGGTAYKGKKFIPATLAVSPGGEYLITGQISGWGMVGGLYGNKSTSALYKDIVCLHFDMYGEFKAQYAVDRLNDDNKSEIFEIDQNFYFTPDGKSAVWEIRDVKGVSGFENFMDFYYGRRSFYGRVFPRIGKINLEGATVSDFQVLGEQKYFFNDAYYVNSGNAIIYVGRNEDESQIWLAKVELQ